MLNNVVLSGQLEGVYEMKDNQYLGKINVEGDKFYIYWDTNKVKYEVERLDYVVVRGYLSNIKVCKENISKNIVAVEVRSIEKYDF